MCFVNVLDSLIPVTMLSSLRSKSSVLFGTHTLLDNHSGYYNFQHIYLI